jgi:hypothetical protein
MADNPARDRLDEAREKGRALEEGGPYLSVRQWGTFREDYSDNGDAWNNHGNVTSPGTGVYREE